ncbi:hypothetical protein ONZ45_g246 [Pleurotus djamor]|nr:hypothetical protein ONZ45_g246 [Pleurotus djamor]
MRGKVTLDSSPPVHRGMMDLDRSAFHRSIPVLAISAPQEKTGVLLKSDVVKKVIMNLPKVRTVVNTASDAESNNRLEADIPTVTRDFLREESFPLIPYTLHLDYDYWTADEILQAVLPEELCDGSPTGFAMTGHIAHMNLLEEYLPYKHLIGQVILDKNKRITTVVNKLDSIDNQFRFFKMELIAGEPNYIVEHHESGCRFTFDFTQVYWNSRLHTEHDRLVQSFQPKDIIADVFAGVGPFALPAAKKGCGVLANDLNPNSAKFLSKNVADNRVGDLVRVSCEDGREFIRHISRRLYDNPFPPYTGPKRSRTQEKEDRKRRQEGKATDTSQLQDRTISPPRQLISHFVMNLPDSAITFLDAFRGIWTFMRSERNLSGEVPLPMIHCHCFTRELEKEKAEADIRRRVEEQLGHAISEDVSFHLVRSVAPNKEMYCISFRLPAEVAFAS